LHKLSFSRDMMAASINRADRVQGGAAQ
jgi:hypothetical protein